MKIQLDTDAKTIKIEGNVTIGDFIKKIKLLLPDDWQKYKLETNTVIQQWASPIIIRNWPIRPWTQPWWGVGAGTTIGGGFNHATNSATPREVPQLKGTYNLEL
jgi:hypothetical protein